MARRKQETIIRDGHKLTVVSTVMTRVCNFAGYSVVVNGRKYRADFLLREDAVNYAVTRWLKSQEAE